MKRIACFCIPAHGHTNPMLPVVSALVKRGNDVRFYSFEPFAEKIRRTGATFVPCDRFLPALTAREEAGLKRVSVTEMTIQDIRTTLAMDGFISSEFEAFRPDVIYTDAVCFWGKLTAWKHGIPMVVSTSTFAFNQFSSGYMKQSPAEMADLMLGLGKVSRALKELEPLGYRVRSPIALVQNDNDTDTVVYTSRAFQPFSESFSDHYLFAGPSVFSTAKPDKSGARPLVYISMGTVINDRPDFYKRCMEAFGGGDMDVIISCGERPAEKVPGPLPENIRVYERVDQPDVLARASAFITHCGMNSVSESLYMATPMALYPQTGEQRAVARRVAETGAGVMLRDDSVEGLRRAIRTLLDSPEYARAAKARSDDFRACPGPDGAAAFIERAPHTAAENPLLKALNRKNGVARLAYWLVAIVALVFVGVLAGWKYAWIVGVSAGVLAGPVGKAAQRWNYRRLTKGR